ncbi:YcxB family protein [Asanoa siamensis]|uniref:YcxB-like C-terminal domain-containing protein n=1 Tax=Asanoa siamensis TaxID=926357 RepID=A0ABQ4CPE7_9ACTN|nr:YcxB family protein [Asanoa siamensis]GIF73173.1 hypothetical protein Asi02nite_26910 [Asanoa siamensis]
MRIVIVAAPDRRRPVAALRYVSRWLFRCFHLLGLAVVALGVFSAVALPGDPVLDLAIIALGLFALAYPTGVVAALRRQQRGYAPIEIEYEIHDGGIITRYADGEEKLRWSDLQRAALLPDLLLLWLARNQYFPIPVDGLTPGERAELADVLDREGLLNRPRRGLWTTSDPAAR